MQPQVNQPTKSPGDASSSRLPAGTKSGKTTAISVELSAGVALPQTLPSGTGMAFSVDYRFTQRTNDEAIRYFWVILPAKGQPITKEVRLEQRGTLQHVVPGSPPEQGPFQTRLDAQHAADSRPSKVTGEVPLK
jgi:hypothetical protein